MSIHINAKPGEIAETVLLPGDPLRAQWIARTFLKNATLYSDTRGMLGFTGFFKGKRVSVQGTGMGTGSVLIYAHELIHEYGVKRLIRVGSAGAFQKNVQLKDIVIAMSASTDSAFNKLRFKGASYAPTADANLFIKAVEVAKKLALPVHLGNIFSSDLFYRDDPEDYKKWAQFGVLCAEMETAPLYTIAAQHQVQALSLLTISDSLITKEVSTRVERETSFENMITLALNLL